MTCFLEELIEWRGNKLFGAKANLTLKIRTDLSGQAKGTTLLCLSASHRSAAGCPIMWVLGWNCDISRGMDEIGVWGMERSQLQITFLMDSILILDLNALLVLPKTLTKHTDKTTWCRHCFYFGCRCSQKLYCFYIILMRQWQLFPLITKASFRWYLSPTWQWDDTSATSQSNKNKSWEPTKNITYSQIRIGAKRSYSPVPYCVSFTINAMTTLQFRTVHDLFVCRWICNYSVDGNRKKLSSTVILSFVCRACKTLNNPE